MARILLTVSGIIAPDVREAVARGERPKPDYLALVEELDADLIDYAEARRTSGRIGRVLERIGGANLALAWACFVRRREYEVIFTDGEQVGIPFALMCKLSGWRRSRHLMIAHILSVPKKTVFFDWLRVQSHIDRFLVYSTWQKCFIERRWKIAPERVIWTPFMVDADFFAPDRVVAQRRRMICSVGLEARDYPTLMRAVDGLNVDVVIAAASPWSKRGDSTRGQTIPPNVTVQRFSQYDLRQLYADCQFVVMPLYPVNFQAGVTTILEAMAVQRPVVCTRTPGQTDVIVDGETGVYVPPGDVVILREAIERLLRDPKTVDRMGAAARARVVREMSLDRYVVRLRQIVEAMGSFASA